MLGLQVAKQHSDVDAGAGDQNSDLQAVSVVHSLNIFPALVLQWLCFLLHEVSRYLVMIKDESGVGWVGVG